MIKVSLSKRFLLFFNAFIAVCCGGAVGQQAHYGMNQGDVSRGLFTAARYVRSYTNVAGQALQAVGGVVPGVNGQLPSGVGGALFTAGGALYATKQWMFGSGVLGEAALGATNMLSGAYAWWYGGGIPAWAIQAGTHAMINSPYLLGAGVLTAAGGLGTGQALTYAGRGLAYLMELPETHAVKSCRSDEQVGLYHEGHHLEFTTRNTPSEEGSDGFVVVDCADIEDDNVGFSPLPLTKKRL